jgi:hypothetical protein
VAGLAALHGPGAVFLDATGSATSMARCYRRSPSDRRLVAAVPHGHWRTTTLIAGLRRPGIVAPLVLDGPMTGRALRAYGEQFLAPALVPGAVVVLDHLARIRATACARRSRPPAPRSCTCRRTPRPRAWLQHRPPRSVPSGAPIE